MNPLLDEKFCEACGDVVDTGPNYWVLLKLAKPYLLPYYFCEKHKLETITTIDSDTFLSESEATTALITHYLTAGTNG